MPVGMMTGPCRVGIAMGAFDMGRGCGSKELSSSFERKRQASERKLKMNLQVTGLGLMQATGLGLMQATGLGLN